MHDILLLLLARATTLSLSHSHSPWSPWSAFVSYENKTKKLRILFILLLQSTVKIAQFGGGVYICGGGGSVVTFWPPVRVRSAQNQGGLLLFTFVVLLCFAFFSSGTLCSRGFSFVFV